MEKYTSNYEKFEERLKDYDDTPATSFRNMMLLEIAKALYKILDEMKLRRVW